MATMWQRYGPALRLAGIACAVAYACASGVTVLMEFADYRRPYPQLVLWTGCAVGYVLVAWRTRAPSRAPALLLVGLLAVNAASAVDPGVGRAATAWVPNLVGAATAGVHPETPLTTMAPDCCPTSTRRPAWASRRMGGSRRCATPSSLAVW